MHRLRIVNPNESGATQGTEVYLDDRKLDGVTRVAFKAELNSICQADISLNVCNVVIESYPALWIDALNFGARRLGMRVYLKLQRMEVGVRRRAHQAGRTLRELARRLGALARGR